MLIKGYTLDFVIIFPKIKLKVNKNDFSHTNINSFFLNLKSAVLKFLFSASTYTNLKIGEDILPMIRNELVNYVKIVDVFHEYQFSKMDDHRQRYKPL